MEVHHNPETQLQKREFMNSVEMTSILEHVRQRIGGINLNVETIRLMYTVCAFETAWRHRRPRRHPRRPPRHPSEQQIHSSESEKGQPASVWCQLLDEDTLRAMEFIQDLKYYWNDGYGYELTQRISCHVVNDMLEHIA